MANQKQNREVTLTARLNDLMTRGLTALRGALGLTEDRMAKTARSGGAMGRTFRLVTGIARTMTRTAGRLGRALLSVRGLIAGFILAFTAGRVVRAFVRVNAELDRIAKQAKQIGLTAQAMQMLAVAADLAGANAETLARGVVRLQRNVAEFVRDGTGESADLLSRLGLNLTDAEGNIRPTLDLLGEVADAVAQIENPADRTRVATELLGRSGAELIPLLSQGGDAIRAIAADIERLAPALADPQTFKNAEAISDAMRRMRLAFQGISAEITRTFGGDIAAWLESVANFVGRMARQVGNVFRGIAAAVSDPSVRSGLLVIGGEVAAAFGAVGVRAGVAFVEGIANAVRAGQQLIIPVVFDLGRAMGEELLIGLGGPARFMARRLREHREEGGVPAVVEPLNRVMEELFTLAAMGADELQDQRNAREADPLRRREQFRQALDNLLGGSLISNETSGLLENAVGSANDALGRLVNRLAEIGSKSIANGDPDAPAKPIKELNDEAQRSPGLIDGIKNGLEVFAARARDTFTLGIALADSLASSLTSGVENAIAGLIDRTADLRDIARATLNDIGRAMLRVATLQVFGSLLGTAGGDGVAPSGVLGLFGKGEAPKFATGGVVPGRGSGDIVPALLTPGEFVMNKMQVLANGGLAALEAQRRSLSAGIGGAARALGRFNAGGAVEGGGGVQYGIAAIGDEQIDDMARGRLGDALAERALRGDALGQAMERIARGVMR